MKTEIPRAEMEQDLADTIDDETRLFAICSNLEDFIIHNGGEDRSVLKTDLLRFQSYLGTVQRLRNVIESRLINTP